MQLSPLLPAVAVVLLVATGCNPSTTATAVIDNHYPADASTRMIVYRAAFGQAAFATPVPPGSSSEAETTLSTSGDRAYVLLAPGWNPASTASPTSFILVESTQTLAVQAGDVLHVPVDDSTFRGDCDAGSPLSQEEADTLVNAFFPDAFVGYAYEAATCTTRAISDAGLHE